MRLPNLPKLPPNWSFGFENVTEEFNTKRFTITISENNIKHSYKSVEIHPEDEEGSIILLIDKTLTELANYAWETEEPDEQWAVINEYRRAVKSSQDKA